MHIMSNISSSSFTSSKMFSVFSHSLTHTTMSQFAFFKFSYNKPRHYTPLLFPNNLPIAPPFFRTTTALRSNAAPDPPLAFPGAADVIIVGAGVAGSALAYTLAKVPLPISILAPHLELMNYAAEISKSFFT